MPAAIDAGSGIAPDLSNPTPATIPSAPRVTSRELRARATEYVAQETFNRRLTLPATDAHGELTVTYAVGGRDSDAAPTMLFIGGMFGGRMLASLAEHVGEKLGIRVVVTDRCVAAGIPCK